MSPDPEVGEKQSRLRLSSLSSSRSIASFESELPSHEMKQDPPSSSSSLDDNNHDINDKIHLGGRLWQAMEAQRVLHPSTVPTRSKWGSLLMGQMIALLASSQNTSSFTLEYVMGFKFPLFLMCNAYFLLALLHLVVFQEDDHHPTRRTTTTCSSLHPCSEQQDEGQDEQGDPEEEKSRTLQSVPPKQETVYSLPFFTSISLRVPWWSYLGLSLLDVAPNYMTLMALKYTSLTSTTLLGSLTVPSAMLACRVLLRKQFQRHHYMGVVLCLVGGSLMMWVDLERTTTTSTTGGGQSLDDLTTTTTTLSTTTTSTHPYSHLGDCFAVAAALFYGIGDALGEFWIKHVDRKEYLGMIGLFGCLYTLLLFPIVEGREVLSLFVEASTNLETFLPTMVAMIWFSVSVVGFYMCTTWFLQSADATLLIISLQTSNVWAILFAVVAYHDTPPPLFYLALVLVVGGVMCYELLGGAKAGERRRRESFSLNSNNLPSATSSLLRHNSLSTNYDQRNINQLPPQHSFGSEVKSPNLERLPDDRRRTEYSSLDNFSL
jgi:solute carrier family 35, member F1/2